MGPTLLQWAGSAMIVLGVAFFALGLLFGPSAYLALFGAAGGALGGLGVYLFRTETRRLNNLAPFPGRPRRGR